MNQTDWSKSVQAVLDRGRAEKVFTHAYAATGTLGLGDQVQEAFVLPHGECVFDLASTTKALVTTPLYFNERLKNGLDFHQSIGDWLGKKANDLSPILRGLSIRSLLRHESGLPAWRNFWVCHLAIDPPHEQTQEMFHARLVEGLNRAASAVGVAANNKDGEKKQIYSDLGYLLLGLALERVRERSLNQLFSEFCSSEFKGQMAGSRLAYGSELRRSLGRSLVDFVPTAYCAIRRRELRGEVHDENCASLGGETAHSGLFGTGPELCSYLKLLAASPTGKLLLRENAAEIVKSNLGRTNDSLLGWRQGSDSVASAFGFGCSMGHYGFTGTAFWVEPTSEPIGMWRFVTLLTNRVFFGRVPDKGRGIGPVRREVLEITESIRRT